MPSELVNWGDQAGAKRRPGPPSWPPPLGAGPEASLHKNGTSTNNNKYSTYVLVMTLPG